MGKKKSEEAEIEEIKEIVRSRYLGEVITLKTIYKDLEENGLGDVVSLPALYRWKQIEKWDDLRQEVQDRKNAKLVERAADSLAETSREHLDNYIRIRRKAGLSLGLEDESLPIDFDKSIEAIKAVDLAIQGERKIQAGMIGKTLLDGILMILTEEINDEATLFRIASKFKKLIAEETL